MRLVLLIPVLILFLSNVPFMQVIPADEAMEMMKNEECGMANSCMKSKDQDCSTESSCETTPCENPEDNCCTEQGASCVCITCFSYAAPIQPVTTFQIASLFSMITKGSFNNKLILDPFLSAPWQPPDFA